jgi:glutaconate CoA-transferase subunit A
MGLTMDKETTAARAIAGLQDGMTIGIGGWGPRRKPMALVRELLRSNLKDLTIVAYGGADVGMLCAAGKVRRVIFAFVSLDFIPLEPYFRSARQNGAIEVMEIDEGMFLLGLKAAAMRIPFIPTRIGLGTDVLKYSSQIKVIDSPYDDKAWVAMPALPLDAALLHVDRADARGVCQICGPDHYMDDLFARAAGKVFVSCDELVDTEFFADPAQAFDVAGPAAAEREIRAHHERPRRERRDEVPLDEFLRRERREVARDRQHLQFDAHGGEARVLFG